MVSFLFFRLPLVVSVFLLLGLTIGVKIYGYIRGDRVPLYIQSSHAGFSSHWTESPVAQMPIFLVDSDTMISVELPISQKGRYNEGVNATRTSGIGMTKIDASEDVKASLTLSDTRFIVNNIVVYHAEDRKSLKKIVIMLLHDGHDISDIEYELIYGPRINRLDASHPSLTTFDVEYRWKSIEVEDFPFAMSVMFGLTLIFSVIIFYFVWTSFPTNTTLLTIKKSIKSRNEKDVMDIKKKELGSSRGGGGIYINRRK